MDGWVGSDMCNMGLGDGWMGRWGQISVMWSGIMGGWVDGIRKVSYGVGNGWIGRLGSDKGHVKLIHNLTGTNYSTYFPAVE